MAHHSLDHHVLPQVMTFKHGYYNQYHVDYLVERHGHLDPRAMASMVRGQQPGVHVLVNTLAPDWVLPLKHLGIVMGVAEVFMSERNQMAMRVNGEIPLVPSDLATLCTRVEVPPKAWKVHAPAVLQDFDDPLTISVDGEISSWKKVTTADSVFLIQRRGSSVVGKHARLSVSGEGLLTFLVTD